jgi:guanylate kinase
MATAQTGPAGADVFLVAAPSGAGKSSLVGALLTRDRSIELSVSFTTREPRPGEADGREYHFVDRAEFARRESAGEFLETAEVHGNRYGTSRAWIEQRLAQGRDVLLEIDWQGARQVKLHFPHSVGIFILPPSLEALQQRLLQRGQDRAEVIARRLEAARGEMAHAGEFDFVIVNDHFETAQAELAAVVAATRLRYPAQAARHLDLFALLGIGG